MTTEIEELEIIVNSINKKLGKKLLSNAADLKHKYIPSGSLSLDRSLGGGWPIGRQVVLWGNRSSTKSTLSLWTIANAQKMGKKCLYIDSEKTFSTEWAIKNGVDVDSLVYFKSNTTEDILEAVEPLLKDSLVDLIVIDSINAINTAKFFDDNNSSIGLHSRSISELLVKLNRWNDDALILLVSQMRTKFQGTRAYSSYSGGMALEFFPSVIVNLLASQDKDSFVETAIQNGNKIVKKRIGRKIRWRITKSKISAPDEEGNYTFLYDGGVEQIDEIIDIGVTEGFIRKDGSWFTYADNKHHGTEALKEFLKHNDTIRETLVSQIMEGPSDEVSEEN